MRHQKTHKFRCFYLIFLALLLILGTVCVFYVSSVLRRYEQSQPENLLSDLLEKIKTAAEENRLDQILTVPEELAPNFTVGSRIYEEYTAMLQSGTLSFAKRPGLTADGEDQYVIKNGERAVAAVTLKSKSETPALLILTISDYEITSVAPIYTCYTLRLPSSLSVSVNGTEQTGTAIADQDETEYRIVFIEEPSIKISDIYGNTVDYTKDVSLSVADYEITAPTNFTVMVGSTKLSVESGTVTENPDYQYAKTYCQSMPDLCTWKLSMLSGSADVMIFDENGVDIGAVWQNNRISVTEQSGTERIPDEILKDVDPLEVAENWSLLMTKDLRGTNYGYFTMKDRLINDSYIDNVAWEWVTGIDITFTSIHTLGNPAFLDESVGRYVRYSDDCFSCDIRFLKHMILETGLDVKDPTNGTYYFANYDDPDDKVAGKKWFLVDVVETKEGGEDR